MKTNFVENMATRIWDIVMCDGLPHRIKTWDSQIEWMRTQGESLLSYRGGAAWDAAFSMLRDDFKNWYIHNSKDADYGDSEAETFINEIEAEIQARLKWSFDRL